MTPYTKYATINTLDNGSPLYVPDGRALKDLQTQSGFRASEIAIE